jgi:regulator of protease activity HflC (stomatin/prohibitin superfamily)
MPIKNAATTLILALLFGSLVAIYLVSGQDRLVTGLSVIIMAISLIVAIIGGWREVGVMSIFAALVSLVAANLLGEARFGTIGAILFPVIWGLILLFIFSWIQRNLLLVPKDRAILIANTYTGGIHQAAPPISPPIVPAIELIIAEIPLYTLARGFKVHKINTFSGHDITAIEVGVVYQVTDPMRVRSGMPNRSEVQKAVAKEMGQELSKARTDVGFWENVIYKQMDGVVDGIVREVVYHHKIAHPERGIVNVNPVDAYRQRDVMAQECTPKLNEVSQIWGVEVLGVSFDSFEVDQQRFRSANFKSIEEQTSQARRYEAEREATRIHLTKAAAAEAEAERVRKLVMALKEAEIDMSPDMLEEIVISAIRATSEVDGDYIRLLPEPVGASKPGDKK